MDYPNSVPNIGLVNGKFVDENPVTGVPGSLIPAAWGNSITDEVVNVVKASGLVPDEADLGQLLLSIQKMNQSDSVKYALDTGQGGAYSANYVPAVKALLDGVVLRFKAQNGNTGASTFSPNGLTAAPIVGTAHSGLQGGEIVANGDVWVQWNSSVGSGAWVLVDSTGGALQVASATKSQHAISAGQFQAGALAFAADSGAANTYVCAFTPAITARAEGQVLRFKVKTANTGASTFNDGLGAVALVGGAHSALQGGELIANGDAWIQWTTSIGTGSYILLFCTGAAEQVAPATQSSHAVNMGQLFGGLKGVARIASSGSFTVPAGVSTLYLSGCAAGGGGGGGGGSSLGVPTSGAGGGGGGAGQQSIRTSYAVTPGQVIAITIGVAGTGGTGGYGGATGGDGTDGGSTVVGSLITLIGGSKGKGGISGGAGGGGGAGYPGGSDGGDCTNNQCTGQGGMGGSSPFGGGGGGGRAGSGGGALAKAAAGFGGGGGGGGGSYGATGSGGNGLAGTPGLVIFEW